MVTREQKALDSLDKFIGELDPNLILVGLLGGLAAYGGIIPPFTRLLMMTSSASGGILAGNLIRSDWDKAALAVTAAGPTLLTGGGFGTVFGLLLKNQLQDQGMAPATAKQKAAEISQNAMFCSGALEAMMMFKAMSQPGLLEAVVRAPAEMLKGVGEIVPG